MLPALRHDTVAVFNGDVLSGVDELELLRFHAEKNADVTLHPVRVADPRAFGSVPTDADGRVTAFLEKTQDPPTDQINAGCYVFNRAAIERCRAGANCRWSARCSRDCWPTGCRSSATSTPATGATWAPRRTSCAARRIWCAASRRRRRWPGTAANYQARRGLGRAGRAALRRHRGQPRRRDRAGGATGRGAVIFDGAKVEAGSVIERSIVGYGAKTGRGR